LGLLRLPPPRDPAMSHGSWARYGEVFRHDPMLRGRFEALARSGALLDTGLFDSAGLSGVIAEHMAGGADHAKLLHQCLTLESWLSRHGHDGVAQDG
ncbi:MAG: hypothetical protein WCF16_12115, partial [Alphaproteobacteria bacterium]